MEESDKKKAAQRIAKAVAALEFANWLTHRTKFDERLRSARATMLDVMTELGYEFAAGDSCRVRKRLVIETAASILGAPVLTGRKLKSKFL